MQADDRHKSTVDLVESACQLASNRSLKGSQHSMEEANLAAGNVEACELQLAFKRVEIQPMDHELQIALAHSLQNTHLSSPDQCTANEDGVGRRWGEDKNGFKGRWDGDEDGVRKNGQEDLGRTKMCNTLPLVLGDAAATAIFTLAPLPLVLTEAAAAKVFALDPKKEMCASEEDIGKNQGFHYTTSTKKSNKHQDAIIKMENFTMLAGSTCGLSGEQLCSARQVFMCM